MIRFLGCPQLDYSSPWVFRSVELVTRHIFILLGCLTPFAPYMPFAIHWSLYGVLSGLGIRSLVYDSAHFSYWEQELFILVTALLASNYQLTTNKNANPFS